MGGGTHGEHGEKGPPSELAALQRGAVLCDRHRQECYQVRDVDGVGVALHRDGTDFYIPCLLFVSWYGQRLFSIGETQSIKALQWCRQHRDDRDDRAETETEPEQRTVIGDTTK